MRLGYFLLAAAATLVAGFHSVSATSEVTTAQFIEVASKRFLRSTNTDSVPNLEKEELDPANEERLADLKGVVSKLKDTVPSLKAATTYTHPLLRPLDEVLESVKSPAILTKMGQNLQARVDENAIARNFVDQYINEKWSTQLLRKKFDITRNTVKTTEHYKAYALLLEVRSYNNILAKTGWKAQPLKWIRPTEQKTKPLTWQRPTGQMLLGLSPKEGVNFGKQLQAKFESNSLAKTFAESHRGQEWSIPLLRKGLGINSATPKESDKLVALTLLRDVQAWNKLGVWKI
ncbi:unnamed protein product [Phytophthora fragariaefolia]|uniref:RxLR effector protein n=1 Tax=Phytophthora fragariaefolia TaxID=1490495 RepID=A0A9W6X6F8_9STRA|nr:unnamed protein product [Phytophthora fragariaefolia]